MFPPAAMKFLAPILVLLSLGTLLPAVSCNPYDDVESVTFPRLRTRSGINFPDVQETSPVHRNLLQNPPAGVKVCDDESAKKREPFWKRSEMGFLFQIEIPKSCKGLSKRELTECTEDINTKSGCCSQDCLNVFRKISPKCWKDLARETCSKNIIEDVKWMDGLRKRCYPDFKPFTCEDCGVESTRKPDKTKLAQQKAELANIAFVEVPDACGKFRAVDLLFCEDYFFWAPGCCHEDCYNLLLSVSDECWASFNANACASFGDELVRLMDDLSKTCEPVHRPVACKVGTFSTPLETSSNEGKQNKKLSAWAIALIVLACIIG